MKDNIQRKLTDLLQPESTREVIVRDIFGTQQSTVYIKEALDAMDKKNRSTIIKLKIKTG